VWLSGVRWAIEQGFEETKTELGMDHYEGRKYPGWHHHMLTCMLAHFFLWHLQFRLEKKAPALTVSPVRRLLAVVLPLKVFQADEVLRYVAGMQQRQPPGLSLALEKAPSRDTSLSSVVGIYHL
jgi:hypothetical protein